MQILAEALKEINVRFDKKEFKFFCFMFLSHNLCKEKQSITPKQKKLILIREDQHFSKFPQNKIFQDLKRKFYPIFSQKKNFLKIKKILIDRNTLKYQ